jgi:hypothetical protein
VQRLWLDSDRDVEQNPRTTEHHVAALAHLILILNDHGVHQTNGYQDVVSSPLAVSAGTFLARSAGFPYGHLLREMISRRLGLLRAMWVEGNLPQVSRGPNAGTLEPIFPCADFEDLAVPTLELLDRQPPGSLADYLQLSGGDQEIFAAHAAKVKQALIAESADGGALRNAIHAARAVVRGRMTDPVGGPEQTISGIAQARVHGRLIGSLEGADRVNVPTLSSVASSLKDNEERLNDTINKWRAKIRILQGAGKLDKLAKAASASESELLSSLRLSSWIGQALQWAALGCLLGALFGYFLGPPAGVPPTISSSALGLAVGAGILMVFSARQRRRALAHFNEFAARWLAWQGKVKEQRLALFQAEVGRTIIRMYMRCRSSLRHWWRRLHTIRLALTAIPAQPAAEPPVITMPIVTPAQIADLVSNGQLVFGGGGLPVLGTMVKASCVVDRLSDLARDILAVSQTDVRICPVVETMARNDVIQFAATRPFAFGGPVQAPLWTAALNVLANAAVAMPLQVNLPEVNATLAAAFPAGNWHTLSFAAPALGVAVNRTASNLAPEIALAGWFRLA